jgi:hypothetical protein
VYRSGTSEGRGCSSGSFFVATLSLAARSLPVCDWYKGLLSKFLFGVFGTFSLGFSIVAKQSHVLFDRDLTLSG